MKRIVLSTTMIALIFMLCACGDGFNSTSIPARDYQTGTPAGIIEATITPRNTPTPMTYSDSSLNELVSQGLDRLYVNSMRVATDEQKRKLCEIHDNRELGYWEEAYERRVAEIMGLIPENWPRVSVSDAKRILQEMIDEELITQEREFPTNLVKERFNEIAFAPDMDGGSGMICVRYYIDSTKTDFIEVSAGRYRARYHIE